LRCTASKSVTLHFHWKNKVTLFEAVHRNLDLYLLALMNAANRAGGEAPLPIAQQIEAWVDLGLEMLRSRPTCARLVMQYLSRNAPPESPDFLKHEQVLAEYVEGQVRQRLPDDPELDVMLLMLWPTYVALIAFCDSPVQRVLLGGSLYEGDAAYRRFRDFAVTMLQRMAGVAPESSAPSEESV